METVIKRGRGRPRLDHRPDPRTTTVKLTVAAARMAKVAAGFAEQPLVDYLNDLILEHAPTDIDRGYAALNASRAAGSPTTVAPPTAAKRPAAAANRLNGGDGVGAKE
jgi:hypothetical protein